MWRAHFQYFGNYYSILVKMDASGFTTYRMANKKLIYLIIFFEEVVTTSLPMIFLICHIGSHKDRNSKYYLSILPLEGLKLACTRFPNCTVGRYIINKIKIYCLSSNYRLRSSNRMILLATYVHYYFIWFYIK